MDKSTFEKCMAEIKKFNAEADEINGHIRAIAQGGWSEVGFSLLDAYCSLLSDAIGDKNEWIGWYCFDNDFGKKGLMAGYGMECKLIPTIDDLWELIEEGKSQTW